MLAAESSLARDWLTDEEDQVLGRTRRLSMNALAIFHSPRSRLTRTAYIVINYDQLRTQVGSTNLAIKALMVDVDGVIVDGRPEDGLHWQTSVEQDFGFTPEQLNQVFFAPHWEDIIVGRAGLMERLPGALQQIAPHVSPAEFLSYWLEKDSRLSASLLKELAAVRCEGIRVYLATNQEHIRSAYLMAQLGLAGHFDGIFYSAMLGTKKPEADFFTRVRASVGLRGEEILLIDDSQRNIAAARQAGWQALHWTSDISPTIVHDLCAYQVK